jgi:hypothetical protein
MVRGREEHVQGIEGSLQGDPQNNSQTSEERVAAAHSQCFKHLVAEQRECESKQGPEDLEGSTVGRGDKSEGGLAYGCGG